MKQKFLTLDPAMPDKVYALSLLVSSLLNKVIAFEERNPLNAWKPLNASP